MLAKFSLFTIFILLLLSACTSPIGPRQSGIETPIIWTGLKANKLVKENVEASIDQTWWRNFNDKTLDALIVEALANNKSLAIAKSRVIEARAGRMLARSRLFPQINGEGSAQRGNQGYLTNDTAVSINQLDVEATWELDLFGRNQARTAAATGILQSREASQHAVRVSLLSEVARTYFDMRNDERQIDLIKQNLLSQQQTLNLTKVLMQEAAASDFDVQRAAAQVSTTEALIPVFQTAYVEAVNRLNVLLGYPPGTKNALLKTPYKQKPVSPKIVIAAPAKVLATRPDIRAAERNFAASISTSQAATRELFPDISLSALFGIQSATPFSSRPWGVGVNLVQPILNFGRIRSQIIAANSRQQQAFLNYQQTVLEALENMENALSAYIYENARNISLNNGVRHNKKATALAKLQYQSGYASLLDVLVAQRNLLVAQSNQATSDASLRRDLVNIYAAAGGGWLDCCEDIKPAPGSR